MRFRPVHFGQSHASHCPLFPFFMLSYANYILNTALYLTTHVEMFKEGKPMLMLLCSLLSPCRTQRRSLTGWRTWWRCTRLELEMWRSWQAWTCTAEPHGATLKSYRSRPTCTPTRVRSDLCWLRLHYITDLFQLWWMYVTCISFTSQWKLWLLCSCFAVLMLWPFHWVFSFISFISSVEIHN